MLITSWTELFALAEAYTFWPDSKTNLEPALITAIESSEGILKFLASAV
jgi:hypothetical protein